MKENIDAPATLLTYLRPKIRRLLEIVNSSGEIDVLHSSVLCQSMNESQIPYNDEAI